MKKTEVHFPRVYQAIPLDLSAMICLDTNASHHLARVLRVNVGDKLMLFNNTEFEYEAIITRLDKEGVKIQVIDRFPCRTESPLSLHLAQGIARGEKMDFIVQKAVELGVNTITPLFTEHCNVKLEKERAEKRLSHWQSVAISACEQSGRGRIPSVENPTSITKWLTSITAETRFVLSPHTPTKLPKMLPVNTQIALLIGPEGGLSEKEVKMAEEVGFLALNLGPRILRTETASIAALSILQRLYGDM